jgi:hypothetical protein
LPGAVVTAVRVDRELAEDLAGGGVDDADAEALMSMMGVP